MSKVIISPNLFLESQELNQIVRFLSEDGYKRVVNAMVKSYGIVMASTNSESFKVSSNAAATVQVGVGLAFDSSLDAIVNNNIKTFSVPNDGTDYWFKLSTGTRHWESGTVSLLPDGSVTGTNTEFTKVLRGQPNYPTKIKLNSATNNSEYEVIKVISDTEIIIAGSLQAESNVEYSVVGCFSPGFQPNEGNKQIYQYDDCTIEIIHATPQPVVVKGKEFLLAHVSYNSVGDLTIEDFRQNYVFNSEYSSGTAKPTNNLLCSLKGWNTLHPNNIMLVVDHGYKISDFTYEVGATTNIINIVSGWSNFTGSSDPVSGFFRGWKLLNRTNMQSCLIDDNNGRELTSSNFSASMIIGEDNDDLVLIPNWYEIEYEVVENISTTDENPELTRYFRRSLDNVTISFEVPILTGVKPTELRIRYRLIQGSESTPFQNLAIAPYTNAAGQTLVMPSTSIIPITL